MKMKKHSSNSNMDSIDRKVGIPNMVVKRLYQAIVELVQVFHVEKTFCVGWNSTLYGELQKESTNSEAAQQWSMHGMCIEQRFICRISALQVLNAM